jgi:hypothetical protein
MKTWRTIGMLLWPAVRRLGVDRHLRQPRNVCSSSRTIFSKMRWHSLRWWTSRGRNTMPTP